MKILLTSQHYFPESFRVVDIAETLVKDGHDVTVLTGLPNYPEGEIYPNYQNGKNRKEEHNGVHIIRCNIIPRKNNYFFRFLNYTTFPIFAKKIVKELPSDFDIVLAMALSPIMMVLPAIYYKKLHGTRILMYEMDLWPSSILVTGMTKRNPIYRYYYNVSKRIYNAMDYICVTSRPHVAYIDKLIRRKIDISYIPQYSEELFTKVLDIKGSRCKNFVFAGNVGKAQSVDTIIKAAELIKDRLDIRIMIVGGGSELERIKILAKDKNCRNVVFIDKRPLEEMNELFANAYAMIISLVDKEFANLTLPGKMQSYMCSGKAIVGAASGYTMEIIKEAKCGICVPGGYFLNLAKAIVHLADNPIEVKEYEKNSKVYYNANFTKEHFYRRLYEKIDWTIKK